MAKPRLLIVASHPTQSHAPLFRELACRGEIDLEVLFLRDTREAHFDEGFGVGFAWDVDVTEGYPHTFVSAREWHLPTARSRKGEILPLPTVSTAAEIQGYLRRSHPDCVLIPGHADPSMLLAAGICITMKIPYLVRGTAVVQPAGGSAFRHGLKLCARFLVSNSSAFCFIGTENFAFGKKYGARSMVYSPYAVDVGRFSQARVNSSHQAALREEAGLDPRLPVVAFSGKLQPWKRPMDILLAAAHMPTEVQVLFIGSGELQSTLEDSASDLGVRAVFSGFVNQSRIPSLYALADVLVLPSERGGDTWGLAVNEGLCLGLTPIVSQEVPCWPDLVARLGYVFPAGDFRQLADCIEKAVIRRRSPIYRDELYALADSHSLAAAAAGIEKAALLLQSEQKCK